MQTSNSTWKAEVLRKEMREGEELENVEALSTIDHINFSVDLSCNLIFRCRKRKNYKNDELNEKCELDQKYLTVKVMRNLFNN